MTIFFSFLSIIIIDAVEDSMNHNCVCNLLLFIYVEVKTIDQRCFNITNNASVSTFHLHF